MRELAFRIVNVFTKDRGSLTGNPLCVFESGTSLDTATMQALARQFNLSETTFVLPSSRATAQVRIFTPRSLAADCNRAVTARATSRGNGGSNWSSVRLGSSKEPAPRFTWRGWGSRFIA